MGTYLWGPHGPQSGPNEVTPNPTPAYLPPPSTPDYYEAPAAAPAPVYGGGPVAVGGGGYTGTYTPRPKGYVLALILSFIFGPFGLFYASKKGALVMLVLLLGVPVTLAQLGVYGPVFHRYPLEILGRDAVMNRWWSVAVFFSMIWAAAGVRIYNSKLK